MQRAFSIPSIPLRIGFERERRSLLLRLWWVSPHWTEIAYILLGLRGLELRADFPSDWHEHRQGWLRLGLGFITFAVAFPWPWVSKDNYACAGHQFGFTFFADGLQVFWGKRRTECGKDPMTIIGMPWRWHHRLHEVLGEPEDHPFRYVLKSGEVQDRIATIKPERRVWTRRWLPWKQESRYIDITFSDEVGERSGSWKGGVIGMSFDMRPGERPVDTLRRMAHERVVI